MLMYQTIYVGLFILLSIHIIHAQQIQQDQYIFKEAKNNRLVSPFTYEWTQLLEQFHNTLGNKNTTKDDSACLYPIPEFNCEPFIWHDAIVDRDAYHLRPSVSFKYILLTCL
jgi:hypothetical protein